MMLCFRKLKCLNNYSNIFFIVEIEVYFFFGLRYIFLTGVIAFLKERKLVFGGRKKKFFFFIYGYIDIL